MADVANVANLPGTALEPGRVVPGATLEDAPSGRRLRVWDYRHRAALVLAFLHPGCERCDRYARWLVDAAADDVATADGRIEVIRDPGSEARRRFLGDQDPPVVVVIDRYGAAWRSYPAAVHDFPEPSEVAATLWHLATMCPECGVPD